MSAADVEVVREWLEAFNRQDYETSTALLHDDVVMYQASEIPGSDNYIGKEAFLHGMATWLSGFERGFQYEPERVIDLGERVFIQVMLRGTGRGSGIELEQRAFQLCEVREGKVSSTRVFWDEKEARKAAGLPAAE
jgi:ketosteroid isomerase-like protein